MGLNMKVVATEEAARAVFEKYKSATRMNFEKGTLEAGDVRVIWSRATLLHEIQTEMTKLMGDATLSVVSSIARVHGADFISVATKYLLDDGLEPTRENLLIYLCAETAAIGWGRIEVEIEDDVIYVTARNGFSGGQSAAASGETTDRAVDAYFLGYFEGWFSKMRGKTYRGQETECLAKGDEWCRLVLKPYATV